MKLTDIDLSDRTEIAAAHALLATLLGATSDTHVVPAGTKKVVISAGGAGGCSGIAVASGPGYAVAGAGGYVGGYVGGVPLELLAGDAPSGADASTLGNVPAGLLDGNQDGTNDAQLSAAPGPATGAPSAPAAGATHASGVQLDAEGIPHDPRIHSSPPSINKGDKLWRAKKGLNDAAFVNGVKAELRALMAVPGGAPLAHAPTAPAPVAPAATVPGVPTATVPGVAPGAPAPAAATAPQAPPATPMELIPRVTSANASGLLPIDALLNACVANDLTAIPQLFQRPDLVPAVYQYLVACYPGFQ